MSMRSASPASSTPPARRKPSSLCRSASRSAASGSGGNRAHPGCLVASFTYEAQQFDDEIRKLNAEGVLSWRRMFLEQFEKVAEKYPIKIEKPPGELADMLSSVVEGGVIMSKMLDDRSVLPNQILQYRSYGRLVFGDVV